MSNEDSTSPYLTPTRCRLRVRPGHRIRFEGANYRAGDEFDGPELLLQSMKESVERATPRAPSRGIMGVGLNRAVLNRGVNRNGLPPIR